MYLYPLFLTLFIPVIAQQTAVPTSGLSTVTPRLDGTAVASATVTGSPNQLSTTASQTTSTSTANETVVSSQGENGEPPFLDTKIDAPFGVLGGLLVLSGLPMLFIGGKNRWTSYFFTGFYALSLISLVLILRFGVQNQVKDPSVTTRGLFLFACTVAGIVGGSSAVLFFKAARPSIGALGGFAFSLLILTLRNNVLIRPIAMRYILIIGLTALGFVLCTVVRLQPYVIVVSTSIIGATAVVLGIDCFTTQNLKEYYIYILGFYKVFPARIRSQSFDVTDSMQIEIGVVAALTICGVACQARILKVLKEKVAKIKGEDEERGLEEEAAAQDLEARKTVDLARWEEKYNSNRRASSVPSSLATTPTLFLQSTPDTPASQESKQSSPFVPSHSRTNSNDILKTHPVTSVEATVDEHPDLVLKKKELEEISRIRKEISKLRQSMGGATASTPNVPPNPPSLPPLAALANHNIIDPEPTHRPRSWDFDSTVQYRDLYAPPQSNQRDQHHARSKSIDYLSGKRILEAPLPEADKEGTLKGDLDNTRRHSSGAVLQAVSAPISQKNQEPQLDIEELKSRHRQHIRELQSSVTETLKKQHEQANMKRTAEKMKREILDKERKNAANVSHLKQRNEVLREETKRKSTSKVLDWQDGKIGQGASVPVKAIPAQKSTPSKPPKNDQNGWLDY